MHWNSLRYIYATCGILETPKCIPLDETNPKIDLALITFNDCAQIRFYRFKYL